MKKLLTLILCLGVIVTTQAQLEVGLKAGVNIANQSSDIDEFETNSATGLYLGLPVRIHINDNLVVQPELAFMQKGSTQSYEVSVPGFYESSGDLKGTLNYLEIPIMVQYLLGDGDIRPYVQAGPSIGIGLGTKSSGEITETTIDFITGDETTETTDIDESGSFEDAGLSGIDFGVGIGAGAIMEAGPGNLSLNLLYNLGFANIIDEGDAKLNNRGLGINVGFSIPIQ